jgi:hypothetical protein
VQTAGAWIADVAADPRGLSVRASRARRLAEERFDIGRIGPRFEQIFTAAVDPSHSVSTFAPAAITLTAEPGSVA